MEHDEMSSIDKVLAVASFMEDGVPEVYGAQQLNDFEERFITDMIDRIVEMTDISDDPISDSECFTPAQQELIDTIWNKAGQPDNEDEDEE